MKPKLYYYEHCPYCVRVLIFLRMANIDFDFEILANDDEKTPMSMVGVKMLPILQTESGYMGESLDIIRYLSKRYDVALQADETLEAQVNQFLADNKTVIYGLFMPFWAEMPFEEFTTQNARDYFVNKKTKSIGDFDVARSRSGAFIADLQSVLNDNEDLFTQLKDNPLSEAAIVMYSGLYSEKYIDDLNFSGAALEFMDVMKRECYA